MKSLKKVLSVILCAVTLITAAPLSGFVGMKFPEIDFGKIMRTLNSVSDSISPTASASMILDAGSYENVEWAVESDSSIGLLVIGCNGKMPNFNATSMPWYKYRDAITEIVFLDGITSIGECAFSGFTKVKKVGRYVSTGSGTNSEVKINYNELPSSLTSIGYAAFGYCFSLESIHLPSNLQSIGENAFYECTSLTSITLPDSVTSLDDSAFEKCTSLTSVDLSDNLSSIPSMGFAYCSNLSTVNFPSALETVANHAFFECTSLTSVSFSSASSILAGAFWEAGVKSLTLPSNISFISPGAFNGCPLTTISLSSENTHFSVADNVLYNSDKTELIIYPSQKQDSVFAVPQTVRRIEDYAFYNNRYLSKINFSPVSVLEHIGTRSFEYCTSLNEIYIPSTVTSMGYSTFCNCYNLSKIVFLTPAPPSGESYPIYGSRFTNCAATKISIPFLDLQPDWKKCAQGKWEGLPVTNYTEESLCMPTFLDSNNTDTYGFTYDNFDIENHTVTCIRYTGSGGDVVIPRIAVKDDIVYYVTSVAENIFDDKNTNGLQNTTITSLTLPNTFLSSPYNPFSYCTALESVNIESGNPHFISVDGVVFSPDKKILYLYPTNKSEDSYTVPAQVETIAERAFENTKKLKAVSFESGSKLTVIDTYAFNNSNALESIELPSSLTSMGSGVFTECRKLKTVSFAENSKLTTLPEKTFYYCTRLDTISLPSGLKNINTSAFSNCYTLQEIILPSGLQSISEKAFEECRLKEINIPASLSYISPNVFYCNTTLKNIYVDDNNQNYKDIDGILYNKTGTTLHTYPADKTETEFIVPASVCKIEDYAFFYSKNLNRISFPTNNNILEIGSHSIYYCRNLQTVDFCEGTKISSIGKYAFASCSELISISLDKCSEISSIGDSAFSSTKIENLTFTCKTAPTIPKNASLFGGSPLEEIYVTDLYTKNSWMDYFESGFGGLPLTNKSTTGEVMSTVDENYEDNLGFIYDEESFDDSTYSVTIKAFSGSGDVVVPRYIVKDNKPYFVRSFDDNVFAGNEKITSISFNDKIESIPASAFSGCTALESVSFLSKLSEISDYAFSGCTSLKSVTTNGTVEKIGNGAFYGCKSLPSNLIIPASVTTIGNSAFSGCSLKTVQIEGTLSYLGENAFGNNENLTRAKFKSNPPESVGTEPFGSPEAIVVVYPDSNTQWSSQVSNFRWKDEYLAYTYSLISQLNSDDSYPILVMTVTPDGAPYEGATVKLGDNSSTSNEDGITLFAFPQEEKQKLTVTPVGDTYLETSKELTLSRRSPVIIVKLSSAKDLIEVTVDGEDTETTPAVFNNASFEEAKFTIKAIADDIESIELLSGDTPICFDKDSEDTTMFNRDQLYTEDGLKKVVTKTVELKEFSEQKDVIIRVKKTDGTASPIPLNITVFNGGVNWGFTVSGKEEDKEEENKNKFKFNKDQVEIPEDKISLEGSGVDILKSISLDLKLDDFLFDVEFEQEQLKDCVKYYVGAGKTEDEGEIKHAAAKRKNKNKMFNLREDAKSGFAIEGDIAGYIKIGRTSDHKDFIKEFCLYLALNVSYDFGVTWTVLFVPLRLEISVTGAIEVKVGGTRDYVTDKQFRVLFETDFTAALRVNLGIGVKGLNAGVYGSGSIRTSLPSLISTLSGEFGVYAKVLFWHQKYAIFEGSKTFGGKEKTVAEKMLTGPELHNTSHYEPLEMIEPSLWNSSAVDEGESVSLQTDIYNYIRPQLISTNDTVMMVFERMNTEYELQNSQELVFSLYNKETGTWSEPQPIEPGDEKFDNNFTLYTDGTDIYIAFTQSHSVNNSSVDTVEEGVLYQEVYVTKYDTTNESFSTPERLTENNSYDVTADIAVIDGVPTAVWVRNENGEPFTLDNSNSIYMSRYEESKWSDEIQLAAGLNAVTGLDIGTLDGKSYVAVAADSDNSAETPSDSKLYLIDADKDIITKEITDFGGSCEFTEIGGKDVLLTFCDGKAMTISTADGEAEEFAAVPEMVATAGAQFLEYKNGMYAISYLSMNEQGGCVRAVTYDGSEWHDAITLSESEDYVGAYALDYRDGQFIVVMREDDLTFTSGTDFTVESTLGGIAFAPSEEMYVSDAVIDSAGIIPGEEFMAALNIVNNSVSHSQYANVILRDAYGSEISSAAVEVDIKPGESRFVDVTLTAPESLSSDGYTITVEPVTMARTMSFRSAPVASSAKEPKAFSVSLSASDLCVETQQIVLGSSQNVLVNVTNDGCKESNTGTLYVRKGDALSSDEPFAQIELSALAPGETKSYLVEVPGEIYENGDGIVTAYIKCDGDMYATNNRSTLAILKMSEGNMIYTPDENTAPVLSAEYIEADLYSLSDKTIDITLNENTFKGIDGLTPGTHYTFKDNTLTLKKAYLSTLTTGTHDITLNFKGRYEDLTETLSIYVTDSSPISVAGSVTISGEAIPGNTLIAVTDNVTPSYAKYDIQWYVGGAVASEERTYKVKDSDTGKQIYVKLTAKDGYTGSLTSPVLTVKKTNGNTEFAPVEASKTCNSITLIKTDGYEYRISTGSWSTDITFSGLSADTEYTFYSRKAETAYSYAGNQSAPTVIKTMSHAEGTPPTCTSPQKCTVCGAEIKPVTAHMNTKTVEAVNATCSSAGYTEGVYCLDCEKYISGREEIGINSNNHEWDSGKITTSATCKVNGIKTYTCLYNSSHKKTENLGLNAEIHVSTKNTAAVAPTCSEVGYTAGVYCNDCEEYISGHEEIGIDKNAHKWNNGEITTVATCKVNGVKTYTCEYDKNHTYTEDLGLDITNHVNTKNTEEVKATCTDTGYTAGVYCNDCEKYISGHKETGIDSDAHKWNSGEITTVATCKVNGVKTYTCEYDTNHKKTEDLGLDTANHVNTKNTEEIKATCSETGFTAGVYCNDCEKYISGHEVIGVNENAHKWNSGEITTVATCKVNGVKTYTCEYDTNHKKTEDLGTDTANHENTKNTEAVTPTCSAVGYTEGVYCNDCEKYISGHNEIGIDENAHKWDSGKITTVATCKVNGIRTYTCEYDKKHICTENLGLNSSNHTDTKNTEAVTPTCSAVGYTEGVYCNDCETYISGHNEIGIDENAHKWNDGEITTVATCKVNGVRTYTCEYDEAHSYTEDLGLNTANHVNTKNTEEVKATCSETGFTAGVYCNDCEKFISGHEVIGIDADAHKWDNGEITTVATCKVNGIKTFTCEYDETHTRTDNIGIDSKNHINTTIINAIPPTCTKTGYTEGVFCYDCSKYVSGHKIVGYDPTAHRWDSGKTITTATCTVSGVMLFTCLRDEMHTRTENIGLNAENHVHTINTEAVAPTCIKTGFTAGVYCNDCEKYVSGHEVIGIDSTAHNWDSGEITTVATCTVNGIKTYTCEYDTSHKKTEDLGTNSANHVNTKNTEAVAATCSSVGYTAGVYCNDCEEYISGHEETGINKNAHKWNDGEITTVATCKVNGIKTYTCEYDTSHKKTEDLGLDAANHVNTKAVKETAATCTSIGYTAGTYCSDCEKLVSGHEEIPAPGHSYKDKVTLPTCTSDGYTAHICTRCNDTYTDTKVNATGHKWGEWTEILAPTLTENGKEERVCSLCNKKETRTTDKLTLTTGDVNGDEKITAADARLALRASVGLESFNEAEKTAADIDRNGEVTAADARLILRASVGLEDLSKYNK